MGVHRDKVIVVAVLLYYDLELNFKTLLTLINLKIMIDESMNLTSHIILLTSHFIKYLSIFLLIDSHRPITIQTF